MKKSRKESGPSPVLIENTKPPVVTQPSVEAPIVEVKEKLVEVANTPVDPNTYFVIIGSFRNLSNAISFQKQIATDGFTSTLLQNEAGLYRVSVKSTNDILVAREEIHRIRKGYKLYEDTWLLKSIK